MCRCGKRGKHEVCACTYEIVNTVEMIVGTIGGLLLTTGLQMVSTADVVVGRVPFAWVEGILMIILGAAGTLTVLTLRRWFVAIATSILLVSGVVQIVRHPRAPVFCPCPTGTYGSTYGSRHAFLDDCLPCNCGTGTCFDTVYGDGSCTCPPRYDTQNCTTCVLGATGSNCELARPGWNFVSDTSTDSCTECAPGYKKHAGDCTTLYTPDTPDTPDTTNMCADGWKQQCVKTEDLTPSYPWYPYPWYNPECKFAVYEQTVICDECAVGHNGHYCDECKDCTQYDHDPKAKCQTNQPRSDTPILTTAACAVDQDCDSLFCLVESGGVGVCAANIRAYDDCDCKSVGYVGPVCKPCLGAATTNVGSPCIGGTCQWNFNKKKPQCLCPPGWQGERCAMSIDANQQRQCAVGFHGESGTADDCKVCTCEHGTCNDTYAGNGKCSSCEYSEWIFSGIGMWSGDNCDVCAPGKDKVGCGPGCLPTPAYQAYKSADKCGEVLRCYAQESCADTDCKDTNEGYNCAGT